jgi:hypothetical protein
VTPEEEAEYKLKVEILIGIAIQLAGTVIALRRAVGNVAARSPLSHREGIDEDLNDVRERLDQILAAIDRIMKLGDEPNG